VVNHRKKQGRFEDLSQYYRYLARVFAALPAATTLANVEALLPWNIALGGAWRRRQGVSLSSRTHHQKIDRLLLFYKSYHLSYTVWIFM